MANQVSDATPAWSRRVALCCAYRRFVMRRTFVSFVLVMALMLLAPPGAGVASPGSLIVAKVVDAFASRLSRASWRPRSPLRPRRKRGRRMVIGKASIPRRLLALVKTQSQTARNGWWVVTSPDPPPHTRFDLRDRLFREVDCQGARLRRPVEVENGSRDDLILTFGQRESRGFWRASVPARGVGNQGQRGVESAPLFPGFNLISIPETPEIRLPPQYSAPSAVSIPRSLPSTTATSRTRGNGGIRRTRPAAI